MKIGRNAPCWCNSGLKYKKCHEIFDKKLETFGKQGILVPDRSLIKNKEQIEGIRKSGVVNRAVLDYVSRHICVGMTTGEIDQMVYEKTIEMGGVPAPLNFEGYPNSVCTSVNEQVCHGIPSKNVVLNDGDIVNVDCSTILNGYFSDSSRMFCIGTVDEEKRKLVEVTKKSIRVGLKEVKPWKCMGDMGAAIHEFALSHGYSVVKEIGGHGIGLEFHEEPFVSYVSKRGEEILMVPGMVFTIEPMINMGSDEIYLDEADGWGIYTRDGLPSAQWEVTVAVTEDGYEILAD